nr:hypothetical protein GCM10020092_023450 [Actinoplanes digitatis]
MDVGARQTTWELVENLRADGVSVLLTTHLLDEAESLADHVVIMDGGVVAATGTPAELTAAARHRPPPGTRGRRPRGRRPRRARLREGHRELTG